MKLSHDINLIAYTAQKLFEGGLVERKTQIDPQGTITYIGTGNMTFKGHELLDNIRNDSVWNKAKQKIGSKFNSVSLSIIGSVAAKIIEVSLGL